MRSYLLPILLLAACRLFAQPASSLVTKENASRLATLPLSCISQEFPNKTSHLSETKTDHVLLPHELHPAFYGCLDWHSSVHGHWMLLKLLKTFPDIAERDRIIKVLSTSFSEANIFGETAYFEKYKTSNTYERTYGWAWLLKLDQELLSWQDPLGREWHDHLQPLTKKILELWANYLPKQTYPNRTGVHPNTAFGLVFALDWARATGNKAFESQIIEKSKDFYLFNQKVPARFEPDGSDFLSPSLEIADLMRRVLTPSAFLKWFEGFYDKEGIDRITQMPVVSDRTDMQIVHLDGLSLSRAWCMKGLAKVLPANHPYKKLFEKTAETFLQKTLPNVTSGNYGGDHWLASFAVYAIYQ
jgi:hypothetical protein